MYEPPASNTAIVSSLDELKNLFSSHFYKPESELFVRGIPQQVCYENREVAFFIDDILLKVLNCRIEDIAKLVRSSKLSIPLQARIDYNVSGYIDRASGKQAIPIFVRLDNIVYDPHFPNPVPQPE